MSFEVQQLFLMLRVKAGIATRENAKISEVSNQYRRLVGTTMLQGSTPLLFSPDLPSHCTSPSDSGLRWGPVNSPLLSSCGLVQQFNMILRLISSPLPATTMSCVLPHWAAQGFKTGVAFSVLLGQRSSSPITCSCSYLSSLTLCSTCLHTLGYSTTPMNFCPSPFHMLTAQMPPIVHTGHCVV